MLIALLALVGCESSAAVERTEATLDDVDLPRVQELVEQDVRKHDYRDADISSYIPTIEFLLDKGYTVLRIGTITNQPLTIEPPAYFEFFDEPLEPLEPRELTDPSMLLYCVDSY